MERRRQVAQGTAALHDVVVALAASLRSSASRTSVRGVVSRLCANLSRCWGAC